MTDPTPSLESRVKTHRICINLRNDLWQKWAGHVHPVHPVATPLVLCGPLYRISKYVPRSTASCMGIHVQLPTYIHRPSITASTPREFSQAPGNLRGRLGMWGVCPQRRNLGIFTCTQLTEMYLQFSDLQSCVWNYNFTRLSDNLRANISLENTLTWVKHDIT